MGMKNCAVCEAPLPSGGKRKYCGDKCYLQARDENVKTRNAARAATRTPLKGRTCRVCDGTFDAKSGAQKDCGQKCADESLMKAIERQRDRRESDNALKQLLKIGKDDANTNRTPAPPEQDT